jgi:hypothetical protein
MNEKKNIDRLFQEKFKDFEAAPNDAVWDRISDSLPKKKKKRRVIALWWQVGGVAAAIALLLTVGVSVFNSDINTTEDPVIVNEDANKNDIIDYPDNTSNDKQNELKEEDTFKKLELVDSDKNNEVIKDEENESSNAPQQKNGSSKLTTPNQLKSNAVANKPNNNEKVHLPKKRKNLIFNKNNSAKVTGNIKNSENSNKTKLANDSEIKSAIKKTIEDNNTAVTKNSTVKASENSNSENTDAEAANLNNKKKEEALLKDPIKESIEDAIAAQENTDEKEKEDEQSRWSITPNAAPVYFSSLGKGSSIDGQFNDNSKSSPINMSYGIAGTYAISKKLKVRAGVNRVNLSQTTSNVFAFTGEEFASRNAGINGNINTRAEIGNVTLMNANMFNRTDTPEIFNSKIAGNIDQRFGFIEVPLELEYRVLDKKFGVNVIGGFSTFFLNQNEIYADINGTSTLIGEASNINSTSFSANFGLGIDYKLSKQWNINLEPQFKYQINTFNNTSGDFRPFFIGVYTGLSFKF